MDLQKAFRKGMEAGRNLPRIPTKSEVTQWVSLGIWHHIRDMENAGVPKEACDMTYQGIIDDAYGRIMAAYDLIPEPVLEE